MENRFYRQCGKRMLDVAASLVGLFALSPLFVVIALLVKSTSAGPALYRHQRMGRGGRSFGVLKFRTMCQDADQIGPAITTAADSRITPLGRHLRRLKLDELPQLWNVLIGEMSLVGPRPEAPGYVQLYSPEQRQVLSVRPGITDTASIAYRREEELLGLARDKLVQVGLVQVGLVQSDIANADRAQGNQAQADLAEADVSLGGLDRYYREVVLPDKLSMNLEYLDRISLSHDLSLLWRTAVAVFIPHSVTVRLPATIPTHFPAHIPTHEDHSSR